MENARSDNYFKYVICNQIILSNTYNMNVLSSHFGEKRVWKSLSISSYFYVRISYIIIIRNQCCCMLVDFVLFLCLDIIFIRNRCCCMLVNFVLFLCLNVISNRNQYSCIFVRPLTFEVWFVWSIFKKRFCFAWSIFLRDFIGAGEWWAK